MQRIYLLSTGGTIEKVYSEQSGTVENRAAKLDRYLRALRLPDADVQTVHLMNKDSLEMTDADLLAIATYLKERAPRSGGAATALLPEDSRMVAGKAIYQDRCAPCHIDSGAGIPNLFPRLARAPLVHAIDPTSLVHVVLIGSRGVATSAAPTAPAMPAFGWNLNDTEIADLLTYVRNAWGNAAPAVQPASGVSIMGAAKRPREEGEVEVPPTGNSLAKRLKPAETKPVPIRRPGVPKA